MREALEPLCLQKKRLRPLQPPHTKPPLQIPKPHLAKMQMQMQRASLRSAARPTVTKAVVRPRSVVVKCALGRVCALRWCVGVICCCFASNHQTHTQKHAYDNTHKTTTTGPWARPTPRTGSRCVRGGEDRAGHEEGKRGCVLDSAHARVLCIKDFARAVPPKHGLQTTPHSRHCS